MPDHDAVAIANEFIKLGRGHLDQMQLHKLVYMAHGWNLAICGEFLVKDRIEAWDGGPVFRTIWDHIRDWGHNSANGLLGHPRSGKPYCADLSENEKEIINQVWRRYGKYSGYQLSRMTHRLGTPWSNTYFGDGRNATLNDHDIKTHFTELALAGRQNAN